MADVESPDDDKMKDPTYVPPAGGSARKRGSSTSLDKKKSNKRGRRPTKGGKKEEEEGGSKDEVPEGGSKEEEKKKPATEYFPADRHYPFEEDFYFTRLIDRLPVMTTHMEYYIWWLHNAWPLIALISIKMPCFNFFRDLNFNDNPISELAYEAFVIITIIYSFIFSSLFIFIFSSRRKDDAPGAKFSRPDIINLHATISIYRVQILNIFHYVKYFFKKQMDWNLQAETSCIMGEKDAVKLREGLIRTVARLTAEITDVECPYGIAVEHDEELDQSQVEGILYRKALIFACIRHNLTRIYFLSLLLLQFTYEFVCFMEFGRPVLRSTSGMQINLSSLQFDAVSSNGPHFAMRGVSIVSITN